MRTCQINIKNEAIIPLISKNVVPLYAQTIFSHVQAARPSELNMALWNKDNGNVPVKGAVLIYPMLDYRTGGPEDRHPDEKTGEFVWSAEMNVAGWADLKHGQEIPADEFIYYSPAVATPQQLAGFPKTFLIVGTLDLFVYEDMTEEKKQAIMNCETFDDLLDQEYGPLGTPERASFETEAEAFCLAETLKEQRRLAGLTQQELRINLLQYE